MNKEKNWERKGHNTEISCTEIMQKFGSSFRILHSINLKLDFCLPHVYILGGDNCTGKRHDMFLSRHHKFDWKFIHDYEEICQILNEQFHLQWFSGCKSISGEGFALDHLKNLRPSTISMVQFNSHLSGESYKDASTTATHIRIILQFLLTKGFIDP